MAITQSRLSYIDNLRVLAFTTMVFYHACKLFSPEGWGIFLTPMPWAKLSAEIISSWRLPLLFFISGSALSLSIKKQNIAKRFAKKFLPLLIIGTPLLVSAADFLADLHTNPNASFGLHLKEYFVNVSRGHLSWYHLWYLGYILVFVVIHQFIHDHIRLSLPRIQLNPMFVMWVLIAFSLISELYLRPFFPVKRDFIHDWASIIQFACYYCAGILVINTPKMLYDLERVKLWMLVAAGLFLYIRFSDTGIPVAYTKVAVAWSVVFSLNGLFQSYLNFKNKFTIELHSRMLDIYAIHQVTLLFAAILTVAMVDSPFKVFFIFFLGFGFAYILAVSKRQVKNLYKKFA